MKLVENMPSPAYHASPGLSASLLKAYAISAAHGRAAELGQLKGSPEAFAFGGAAHAYVLEPEVFAKEYAMKPERMSFATKEGKAWKADQSRKIVSYDDAEAFSGMRASILADPVAGPFLRTAGLCELSCFDELEGGVKIRARFDKLTDSNVIVDLKTVQSAKPRDFIRQAFYLGWHIQCSWYMDMLSRAGHPMEGMVLIACEKEPPYAVLCAEFDSVSIEKGRSEYQRLMALYVKCHDEGKWPGYVNSEMPYMMTLPKWALESQPEPDQITYALNES